MKQNIRDPYWDVVKGLGILFVLLGHLVQYGSLPSRVIFYFHMPLFFFVSGVFFDEIRIDNIRALGVKLTRNFIVPWLYFVVVCGVCYFAIYGTLMPSTGVRTILGSFWRGNPYVCNSLWFISCLCVVQAGWWMISRCRPCCQSIVLWQMALVLVMLLCVYALTKMPAIVHRYLPLQVGNVPMSMAFFILGKILGRKIANVCRSRAWIWLVAVPLEILIAYNCGMSNMANCEFFSIPLYVAAALLGIISIMGISLNISGWGLLAWVGRNSLIFFLIEWVVISIVLKFLRCCNVPLPKSMLIEGADIITTMMVFALVFMLQCAVVPILSIGLAHVRGFVDRKFRMDV